jgi:hypothetical protein
MKHGKGAEKILPSTALRCVVATRKYSFSAEAFHARCGCEEVCLTATGVEGRRHTSTAATSRSRSCSTLCCRPTPTERSASPIQRQVALVSNVRASKNGGGRCRTSRPRSLRGSGSPEIAIQTEQRDIIHISPLKDDVRWDVRFRDKPHVGNVC